MNQELTASKDKIVSYAQNREGLTLPIFLHGMKRGYYVDVGVNSPIIDSATHCMKRLVWKYAHPFSFALGKLYHNYVKRDQEKELTEL